VADASAALALRRGRLELLDTRQARSVDPELTVLLAPPSPEVGTPLRDADSSVLPLSFPFSSVCEADATNSRAMGPRSPASHSFDTWRAL